MELIYVKNFNCILLWITILVIIISTTTAIAAEHEADESLNTNLNEEEEPEFDNSNVPSLYGLRINPKYYGTLHNLMNKRIKGSEFLDADISSDIYGSQKWKRMPELETDLPLKRLSEFVRGAGKRRIGGAVTPSYYLAKKLSEYLNSSFKRPLRFSNGLLDFYNPRGSEFLGGPGK